jgi:hypothetical protein
LTLISKINNQKHEKLLLYYFNAAAIYCGSNGTEPVLLTDMLKIKQ